MAYVWQRWIADDLRKAGLKVIEVEGWKNRGRPASTGNFDPKGANTTHHTGATTSASSPNAGLQMLISGRPDLPGPLCHVATAYDGTVYVIAAGRANHAGRIGKAGVVGMPVRGDGNAHALGNEVMTNGTQKMPKAQEDATAMVAAVFANRHARNTNWAHRHEDISATGKWDIGQWTTAELRRRVGIAQNELKQRALKLPPRIRRARREITEEIKRIKAARKVAKRKGEKVNKHNGAIKALRNARKRLGQVPKR